MNVMETAEGKFGFTRKETKPGDTIVILHGARIPYALRKTEDESKYQIVGNCYIEGIMDGEAVDWEEDEAEWFILV
ncbi:HET-domain-containing protein [Neofusicoccum parvum]|uniref:HET-domain-containing protein n=1 Tax=Neofusicoccum parvum TaxID=310453 RepID=A0ACB5SLW1_9PEZI|nr:HET-domain-containing protein [Neofusicoccum parvum]